MLLDMINRVDDSISAQDKQKLKELLLKYKGAISWNEYDLGYTDLVQHSIPTTEGPPVRQKLRRFPPEHAAIIDKQVDVMLKQGIIEPSVSEWSSNVVIVKEEGCAGSRWEPLAPLFSFLHRFSSAEWSKCAESGLSASEYSRLFGFHVGKQLVQYHRSSKWVLSGSSEP